MDVFVHGSWKVMLSRLFLSHSEETLDGLMWEFGLKAVRVGMVNSPTHAQA